MINLSILNFNKIVTKLISYKEKKKRKKIFLVKI